MLTKNEKCLNITKSSSKLIRFNVEDILALPQIKSGKFKKNIASVNLGQSMNEIVDILTAQAEKKKIRIF